MPPATTNHGFASQARGANTACRASTTTSARIAPPPANSSQARWAISAAAGPCGLSRDCTTAACPVSYVFTTLLGLVQCESGQEAQCGDQPAVVVCLPVGLGNHGIGQHRENGPRGDR